MLLLIGEIIRHHVAGKGIKLIERIHEALFARTAHSAVFLCSFCLYVGSETRAVVVPSRYRTWVWKAFAIDGVDAQLCSGEVVVDLLVHVVVVFLLLEETVAT